MSLDVKESIKQEHSTLAHIYSCLSSNDKQRYHGLINAWMEDNSKDLEKKQKRQGRDQATIRAFLESHPSIIQLHNRHAALQITSQKASPLPQFPDLEVHMSNGGDETGKINDFFKPSRQEQKDVGSSQDPQRIIQPLQAEKNLIPTKTALHETIQSPNEDEALGTEFLVRNPQDFPIHLIVNWGTAIIVEGSLFEYRKGEVLTGMTMKLANSDFTTVDIGRPHTARLVNVSEQPGVLKPPTKDSKMLRLTENVRFPETAYLQVDRHPFCVWLDLKGTAWPNEAPTREDCVIVAKNGFGPWNEVEQRIMDHWDFEHDALYGKTARKNGAETLHEIPIFDADQEAGIFDYD